MTRGRSRVLVVRAGALGDLLLLRRVIAGLNAAGHAVSLLAPGAPAAVFRDPGPCGVEDILDIGRAVYAPLFSDSPLDPATRQALAAFDVVVAYSLNPELLRALAKVGPRVLPCPPEPEGTHASLFFGAALGPLDLLDAAPPPFQPTPEESHAAAVLMERLGLRPGFLAVHPGSGSPGKNWPAESFGQVARACAGGDRWLLVRGPADAAAAEALATAPGAVPGEGLPLRALGALLARAGTYLGNDSGVSHLAAAFGAPTVALFGPTDPAVWSPVGRDVVALRSPTTAMAGLAVEPVVAAVEEARRRA